MTRPGTRRGFALITVLWILAASSIVLLRVTLAGRDAFASARNRTALARATWKAEGCADVMRRTIDYVLTDTTNRAVDIRDRWSTLDFRSRPLLDSLRVHTDLLDGCAVLLRAVGARIDVNTASHAQLTRVLGVLGTSAPSALADAIIDWRDPDDNPGEGGAESAWYLPRDRTAARNAPFQDIRELALVRGFEDSAKARMSMEVLGVDEGLLSLNNASATATMAFAGISREAATTITLWQRRGRIVKDLNHLLGDLSASAADTMRMHFDEVATRTVLEPAAWTILVTSSAGSPAVSSTIEWRVARGDTQTALIRRRSWP